MTGRKKQEVEIYSDGACSGNPGPGGYGAILKYGEEIREISGYERETTNNRMEMMAVIAALQQLKRPCKVKIISDSQYVVKGMTQWLSQWIKHKWLNSQKKPVLNKDLWQTLMDLAKPHKIQWEWIKGHDGNPYNERCDQLAREAIKNG